MPLLYSLCFIAIFQETVLGIVGLSGAALFFSRSVIDILSIVVFSYAVLRNTLERRPFQLSGTNYEKFFFAFFLYSIAISLVNWKSSLGINIAEIVVLNRFVFLALSVPLLVSDERDIGKLLSFIWVMIFIQMGIGTVQAVGGSTVIDFFRPNDYSNIMAGTERSFTSNRGLDRNMLIGTLGDFISFAYVLAFGVILLLTKASLRARDLILLVLLLALIFLSGTRTVFLCALFVAIVYLIYRIPRRWRLLAVTCCIIGGASIIAVLLEIAANMEYIGTSFWALLRPELLSGLMNQRLGHLVLYLPLFITDPQAIIGLSPDRFYVANYVNQTYGFDLPYRFLYSFTDTLEDFYPSALISYYGLIGASLFYMAQFQLLKSALVSRSDSNETLARISRMVLLLIIATNLLSLGNQSFENRGLSLMLWMTIGAYSSLLIFKRNGSVSN